MHHAAGVLEPARGQAVQPERDCRRNREDVRKPTQHPRQEQFVRAALVSDEERQRAINRIPAATAMWILNS